MTPIYILKNATTNARLAVSMTAEYIVNMCLLTPNSIIYDINGNPLMCNL